MNTDKGAASLTKSAKLAKGGGRMVPLPTLVQGLAAGDGGGAGSRTPCLTMGLHPGTGHRGIRRPLDCGEHRRSLPAPSTVRAEACRVRQSSGVLDGDAESLGGRGGVGIGGVLCAPESGDSRRSPRAAAKPPLRGPVEPRRRLLDCGEHRRSLPARSAVPVAAFARMQTARQAFGTLTSSATPATLKVSHCFPIP